ncbi:hypothetical protein L7F22_012360 [Adiantum nelumboides]|nr:hypothetical protein [Adiantum nelumboides]
MLELQPHKGAKKGKAIHIDLREGNHESLDLETFVDEFSASDYSTLEEESTVTDESDSSQTEIIGVVLTDPTMDASDHEELCDAQEELDYFSHLLDKAEEWHEDREGKRRKSCSNAHRIQMLQEAIKRLTQKYEDQFQEEDENNDECGVTTSIFSLVGQEIEDKSGPKSMQGPEKDMQILVEVMQSSKGMEGSEGMLVPKNLQEIEFVKDQCIEWEEMKIDEDIMCFDDDDDVMNEFLMFVDEEYHTSDIPTNVFDEEDVFFGVLKTESQFSRVDISYLSPEQKSNDFQRDLVLEFAKFQSLTLSQAKMINSPPLDLNNEQYSSQVATNQAIFKIDQLQEEKQSLVKKYSKDWYLVKDIQEAIFGKEEAKYRASAFSLSCFSSSFEAFLALWPLLELEREAELELLQQVVLVAEMMMEQVVMLEELEIEQEEGRHNVSALMVLCDILKKRCAKFSTAFLVLHGTGDTCTSHEDSKMLYDKVNSFEKIIKLYDVLYHSLL